MGGSGPHDDAWLIGSMIVLGLMWLGAMYMLITACIAESRLADLRRKLRQDRMQ
jgi:hypothetical protein